MCHVSAVPVCLCTTVLVSSSLLLCFRHEHLTVFDKYREERRERLRLVNLEESWLAKYNYCSNHRAFLATGFPTSARHTRHIMIKWWLHHDLPRMFIYVYFIIILSAFQMYKRVCHVMEYLAKLPLFCHIPSSTFLVLLVFLLYLGPAWHFWL